MLFLGNEGNYLREELNFAQLSEIEAILGISVQHSTFENVEKLCTDALGVLAKQ